MPKINTKVLMSGADFFSDAAAINAYMTWDGQIDLEQAKREHQAIREALESAGVEVIKVDPPADCQDGVYSANWALVRGDKAVMARLPNARQAETPYAAQILQDLGKEVIYAPEGLKFSGQGDALPVGNYLLAGSGYRSDPQVHQFLADTLGYEVITLQTIPELDANNNPVINASSGWPDSFFYDIDLAISILREDLIAWCPDAFVPESQEKIRALPLDKIEVSYEEATQAFACNLVSTGEVVIMSSQAPKFQAAVEAHGLRTSTLFARELAKGGGFIRCTSLTLNNI